MDNGELLLSANEADWPAPSQVSRRVSLLIRSTVLGVFAGVGGLCLGFEHAGFDVAGRLVPIEVKRWASPRPGGGAAVKTLQKGVGREARLATGCRDGPECGRSAGSPFLTMRIGGHPGTL